MLAAKLLHVPCTAVYHTDFTRQARQIIGDETVCRLTEEYINWFHSQTDSVAVSTREYMTLLERRGLNRSKMKRFRRGIDPNLFTPASASQAFLTSRFGITGGFTLLHCGRVSKEKNVDFLAEVYEAWPKTKMLISSWRAMAPIWKSSNKKCADFPKSISPDDCPGRSFRNSMLPATRLFSQASRKPSAWSFWRPKRAAFPP